MITRLIVVIALLFPLSSFGHKASDSFLYLTDDSIRLDIALQDMLRLENVDRDGDGLLRWREVRESEAVISSHILNALVLREGEKICALDARLRGLSRHSDGAYSSWSLSSPCLQAKANLALEYGLLFDIDPLHRGLYRLALVDEPVRLGALSPSSRVLAWQGGGLWQTFSSFFWQGAIHMVSGYDHILFLLALLLPLARSSRENVGLASVFRETAWVVTMFTVAHSVTLALASLGWVSLPAKPVEVTIALSISVAALLALPRLHFGWQMAMAFGFGLVHGLGFAGMLAEYLAATDSRFLALLSFNVGIELAQLLIVALMLPLLYHTSRIAVVSRIAAPCCVAIIASTGVYWAWIRL